MHLFISVFNRPDYVKESLASLAESFDTIVPTVVITDDGSTDKEIPKILEDFKTKFPQTIIITNEENVGLPDGKLNPIYEHIEFEDYDEEFFIMSDSDMIYKKGWIEACLAVQRTTNAPLVTPFNTETNFHYTLNTFDKEEPPYRWKYTIGGACVLVNTEFYRKYPFTEERNWDYMMCAHALKETKVLSIISTVPSYADHIGKVGQWAKEDYYDQATDFELA